MSADELIAEITDSFQPELRPDDLHIVTNNEPGYDLESLQIRDSFRAYTWQTVPDDLLLYEQAALSLLSPRGFKYYLPAFLRLAVRQYAASDALPDSLVFHLTLPTHLDAAMTALIAKRNALLIRLQQGEKGIDLDWPDEPPQVDNANWQVHFFIARACLFSRAQGRAIYHFLTYLRDKCDSDYEQEAATTAIERYWFQFE